MTRLIPGQVAVVEIEITDKSAIQEGGAIRRRFAAAADQCALTAPAEIVDLLFDQTNRVGALSSKSASKRVQHTSLQFARTDVREIQERSVHDEIRQMLCLRHIHLLRSTSLQSQLALSSFLLLESMHSNRSFHDLLKASAPSRCNSIARTSSSTPTRANSFSTSSASPPLTGMTPFIRP